MVATPTAGDVLLSRYFDEAFGNSSGAPDAGCDLIEYSPDGLRLTYSAETALWLSDVVERPGDFGLVFEHLINLLGSTQPLGRLTRGFIARYNRLYVASSTSSGGKLEAAVAGLTLGLRRLTTFVLEALPPLREPLAFNATRSAIEVVLFEGCGDLVRRLIRQQVADADGSCAQQARALAGLLPRHLGLARRMWLGGSGTRGSDAGVDAVMTDQRAEPKARAEAVPYASAIAMARAMEATPSPRAKLRCFLRACAEAARHVDKTNTATPLLADSHTGASRTRHSEDGGGGASGTSGNGRDDGYGADGIGGCGAEGIGGCGSGDLVRGEDLGSADAPPPLSTPRGIGADELIPLMAYVLARAQLPHLASDLRLVETFVTDESELLGELGYGIATLHAAISLLRALHWTDGCTGCEAAEPAQPRPPSPPPTLALLSSSPPEGAPARAPGPSAPLPLVPPTSPAAVLARAAAERGARWLDEVVSEVAAAARDAISPSRKPTRRTLFSPATALPADTATDSYGVGVQCDSWAGTEAREPREPREPRKGCGVLDTPPPRAMALLAVAVVPTAVMCPGDSPLRGPSRLTCEAHSPPSRERVARRGCMASPHANPSADAATPLSPKSARHPSPAAQRAMSPASQRRRRKQRLATGSETARTVGVASAGTAVEDDAVDDGALSPARLVVSRAAASDLERIDRMPHAVAHRPHDATACKAAVGCEAIPSMGLATGRPSETVARTADHAHADANGDCSADFSKSPGVRMEGTPPSSTARRRRRQRCVNDDSVNSPARRHDVQDDGLPSTTPEY